MVMLWVAARRNIRAVGQTVNSDRVATKEKLGCLGKKTASSKQATTA